MYAGHLDLSQPLVWTVDDALDAATCSRYAARIARDAEVAPVITTDGVAVDLEVRNNSRVIYRYGPGERHGAHWDTIVELAGGVRSLVTLVFYLNDGFAGGDTEFPELRRTIEPRRGRALLFQHRVLHEATAVTRGEKLVLRTDVLYRGAA